MPERRPTADAVHAVAARPELGGHDPVAVEFLLLTVRASRLLLAFLEQRFRPLGLDVSQAAVLAALLVNGAPHRLSPTALRRALVQTSGGMTKTIDRLERAGLVRREPDEHDGRARTVVLTAAGRRVVRRALGDAVAPMAAVLGAGAGSDAPRLLGAQRELVALLETLPVDT